MSLSRPSSFVFLSLMLAACSASDDQDPSSTSGQCITGNARDADHESVVALGNEVETWCSGALIARDLVLTTAKCLEHPNFTRAYSGPGVARILNSSIPSLLGFRPHGIGETRAHPGYSGEQEPNDLPDLALVRLDAPADIAPFALAQSPPAPSEACVAVGYGEVFSPERPEGEIGERKIANVRVSVVREAVVEVERVDVSPTFAASGGALICGGKLAGIGLHSGPTTSYFKRVDAQQRAHSEWIATNSVSLTGHRPCGE